MMQVYQDGEALANTAAAQFVEKARQAILEHQVFNVVLSGGTTPKRMFELLAAESFRDQVNWGQVAVFWGDERYVAPEDSRSNQKMAREALLNHVLIPPTQIYAMPYANSAAASAIEYEAELRQYFQGQAPVFDLIFLGLGENGHTASLFPDTPVLDEQSRWVADVYVADQDMYRVTLTAPVINQAKTIIFLVEGPSKAQVLHEVLEGPRDPHHLPAQLIQPKQGELIWMVDQAAVAQMSRVA